MAWARSMATLPGPMPGPRAEPSGPGLDLSVAARPHSERRIRGAQSHRRLGIDQSATLPHLAWAGAWYSDARAPSPIGAWFETGSAACSWGLNRIDVFGLDRRGNLLSLARAGGWHWDTVR